MLLGLVEMTSGLVNAIFSLPEWQAVKMIFFAPCVLFLALMSRVVNIVLSLIVVYTRMQDDVNTSMARGVLYLDACTHISKVH